ncbi:hypothetical protein ACQPZX_41360 [Actinoplanes sp. CA-142083]|uniref:hypothetical protein n=1 Tax=Actinoplanes sp. CA-142083 TaxID=3239903 RepID=UPI003D8C95FD
MAKTEYQQQVESMIKHGEFLSRVRAERGPTARQIAAHKADRKETERQLRAQAKG